MTYFDRNDLLNDFTIHIVHANTITCHGIHQFYATYDLKEKEYIELTKLTASHVNSKEFEHKKKNKKN